LDQIARVDSRNYLTVMLTHDYLTQAWNILVRVKVQQAALMGRGHKRASEARQPVKAP